MIKIATWNINSVRLRADLVARFLTQAQPDILCLQEIKCREEHVSARDVSGARIYAYRDQRPAWISWGGNGLEVPAQPFAAGKLLRHGRSPAFGLYREPAGERNACASQHLCARRRRYPRSSAKPQVQAKTQLPRSLWLAGGAAMAAAMPFCLAISTSRPSRPMSGLTSSCSRS